MAEDRQSTQPQGGPRILLRVLSQGIFGKRLYRLAMTQEDRTCPTCSLLTPGGFPP